MQFTNVNHIIAFVFRSFLFKIREFYSFIAFQILISIFQIMNFE